MSRMIDLIRASALPSNVVQSAAKGALAVPAEEMIEILVHLATHNPVFKEQARLTLAGWYEASSKAAAANPETPKEVLDYLVSPQNLRPVLLPALLENPAIGEEALVALGTAGSRETVETMLNSARVSQSPTVLEALSLNVNLSGIQTETIKGRLAVFAPAPPEQPAADGLLEKLSGEAGESDDVLDAEVIAYLTQHMKELAEEGEKPFQPIGGFYDDLLLLDEAYKEAAAAGDAATAGSKRGVQKKSRLTHDEERGSALQKISRLDVKGRIQLAMKGTKEERSILVRDGTKLVALAVLESPKISDGEVEKIAAQKNVLESVLRYIPMKRRFMKHYPTVRALVFNPRTPLDVSLTLIKNLLTIDLKHLSGNKDVSDTIRKMAFKMFKMKLNPDKKDI